MNGKDMRLSISWPKYKSKTVNYLHNIWIIKEKPFLDLPSVELSFDKCIECVLIIIITNYYIIIIIINYYYYIIIRFDEILANNLFLHFYRIDITITFNKTDIKYKIKS
jgi:hypothetical protein